MLSIRPYQCCTNSAVNNRMNPPRQISSILCWSSADCSTASNAARSSPKVLLSMVSVAMPLARAFSRPPASPPVGNHQRDLGREIRRPGRLDQRGHVRSAPGNQDCDTALHGFLLFTMPDRDDRYRPRDVRLRRRSPCPAASTLSPASVKISVTCFDGFRLRRWRSCRCRN